MSYRHFVTTEIQDVLLNKLIRELVAEGLTRIEGISPDLENNRMGVDFPEDQPPTEQEETLIKAVVDKHDATDYVEKLVKNSENILQDLVKGLSELSPRDAAYAYYGRSLSFANDGLVDESIVDKASAQAYITGLTKWQALPASARSWLAIQMEGNVVALYALFRVLQKQIT